MGGPSTMLRSYADLTTSRGYDPDRPGRELRMPDLVETSLRVMWDASDVLGQKLASLGRTHQVVCVTHLPQVASYARHQWTIRKESTSKRTATTIAALTSEESRIEELALMLRGESRSETTRKEAAEMLRAASKERG